MLNPPVNGKIQGLFKVFECFQVLFKAEGSSGNGKTEFQDFFFIFQGLNFFPILYKTTRKK